MTASDVEELLKNTPDRRLIVAAYVATCDEGRRCIGGEDRPAVALMPTRWHLLGDDGRRRIGATDPYDDDRCSIGHGPTRTTRCVATYDDLVIREVLTLPLRSTCTCDWLLSSRSTVWSLYAAGAGAAGHPASPSAVIEPIVRMLRSTDVRGNHRKSRWIGCPTHPRIQAPSPLRRAKHRLNRMMARAAS